MTGDRILPRARPHVRVYGRERYEIKQRRPTRLNSYEWCFRLVTQRDVIDVYDEDITVTRTSTPFLAADCWLLTN